MKRHTIINIVIPALMLMGVALWIVVAGQMIVKISEQPTEQQLIGFHKQLEENELTFEQLRDIVRADLAHDASLKKAHQAANEFIRWAAIMVVIFAGWLAYGCYWFSKKLQTIAVDNMPRPGEVDVSTRAQCN